MQMIKRLDEISNFNYRDEKIFRYLEFDLLDVLFLFLLTMLFFFLYFLAIEKDKRNFYGIVRRWNHVLSLVSFF